MPTLTPCSAASAKLKQMRLPNVQRRVGLPIAERIAPGMNVVTMLLPTNATAVVEIALKKLSTSRPKESRQFLQEIIKGLIPDKNEDELRSSNAICFPELKGL